MAFKTPGVYIEEIASFPPSVVAVETAVPAFIGYTEQALDNDQNSLAFVPTKIKSLLDYESYFGKGFVPDSYRVTLDTSAGNTVTAIDPRDASDASRRYYLYECIKSFYQNGGGACSVLGVACVVEVISSRSGPTATRRHTGIPPRLWAWWAACHVSSATMSRL